MSVGFERGNKQMLMSLNWLEEMKNSVTFYLLQTDQLVIKIDGSYILDVHCISVLIERCVGPKAHHSSFDDDQLM